MNRDRFFAANVEHAAVARGICNQLGQHMHDITHIAKATRLLTIAMHFKISSIKRGAHEAWKHHAVLTDLTRTDGVEKPRDDRRKSKLAVIRQCKIFINGL